MEMMRMKQRITSLILLTCLTVMLAGCDETLHFKKGDQLRFTVTALEGPGTKTNYAGYTAGDTYERIEWVAGDRIRIFSMNPSIVSAKWSDNTTGHDYYDYTILQTEESPIVNENRESRAHLTRPAEGYGMVWVDSPEGATFYGVYPTAEPQYKSETENQIVAFQGMTILATQQGAQPDMGHAYMVSAPAQYASSTKDMKMLFYPFFNAFYIELKSEDSDIKINSVTLSSTSDGLAGDYKYMFLATGNGIPSVENVTYNMTQSSNVTKSVTADLTSMSDANRTATKTHAVAVTLLTLPPMNTEGLTNMTLTVNYGDNQQKSLALNDNVTSANPTGTPIKFKPFYKTRITGLAMKGNKWQLTIDDQVLPWIKDEQTTSFKSNIGITNQKFSGYVVTNPLYIYEDVNNNILRQTTPYYDGQAVSPDGYYYLNNGKYTKNGYYIRLTTKIEGEDDPCITYQFTPTMPIGGYWQLSPEAVEGSLDYFRITVDDGINGESTRLQGQVMGVPVTIYIRPTAEYLALDNAPVCSCIIKCNMSPSANWDPLYSADSEFQSAHTDGTFSYNKFRIAK